MARFPLQQASILQLAEEMIAGLNDNPAIYPSPPVPPAEFQAKLTACRTTFDEAVAARAAYEKVLTRKVEQLAELAEVMKRNLRYAENTVAFDDDKLKLLGWAGKKPPTALTPPGQVLSLRAIGQGEGWISLEWKEPVGGGKTAAYRIQRRQKPNGSWTDTGMSVKSEIRLEGQQRGIEWEYRIIAVNKAGEGKESNTVMAVL